MAVSGLVVTVATTATLLASADTHRPENTPVRVYVTNVSGDNTVYLGGATVDTTDGYPLPNGESVTLELGPGDDLYGIVAAATEDVKVLRTQA